jgi:3-deoxy-manno-octulosonate cytidylyltransferase (CMP-KDO synthetase)
MGASRFPGKPLAKILDLPMIEHVRRRTCMSDAIDQVVVATCDQEIVDVVTGYGGQAIMTADTHERCTDRVEEAIQKIDLDIAVIVQGDEPLFDPAILQRMVEPFFLDDEVECTNLLSLIHNKQDLQDQDIVKAVLTEAGDVMSYSRSAIPFQRVPNDCPLYRQTGLSAFSKQFLHTFAALAPTSLEVTESVDFLRILGHAHPIRGVIFDGRLVGVDRPEDVDVVEKLLQQDPIQKQFYERMLQL